MQQIQLQLPEEYQSDISFIKQTLVDLEKHFQPKEPTEYLTRIEVTKMLKIKIGCLYNWTKEGILTSYQIGGRVYYKRSEIDNSIEELKHQSSALIYF